jgi:tRNA-Thr(GGU) m(6)t(6)A37 methyltransferase TsaA
MMLRSIGVVRNKVNDPHFHDWEGIVSEIVIDERYASALDGIEEYSHLYVLYWFHKRPGEQEGLLKVRPRRRADLPLVGVFATRSTARPNPIGLGVVELLSREGNKLKVRGLDAINGTPVLDLKPYQREFEALKHVKVPRWLRKLG